MTKIVEKRDVPRIVIADDAGLIYSDDWRRGWLAGFTLLGCKVTVVDISPLRRSLSSPYAATALNARGSAIAAGIADAIVRAKPDLVWCHHGRAGSNDFFLSKLRRNGIRSAVYLCDEPYEVGETARYSPKFDYVFSMDWMTVETHKNARTFSTRTNVFYLPPCVDNHHFELRPYAGRSIPAFFLGNPTLIPRAKWLKAVEDAVKGTDIRYWPQSGKPVAKGHPRWISAEDHPKWYSNCLVGLNVHRHPGITKECFNTRIVRRHKAMTVPNGSKLAEKMPTEEGTGFWNDFNLPASHINPRAMEFFACGTLVVSDDHRSELERLFPMAPRAATPERFVELVKYYIEHPTEAEEIGRECSRRTSRLHTYRHRAFEALTRVGLSHLVPSDRASCLGAPEDFLTPQDSAQLKATSSSEQTGRSEPWSPQYGLSLMRPSGNPSQANSLDAPPLVLPW